MHFAAAQLQRRQRRGPRPLTKHTTGPRLHLGVAGPSTTTDLMSKRFRGKFEPSPKDFYVTPDEAVRRRSSRIRALESSNDSTSPAVVTAHWSAIIHGTRSGLQLCRRHLHGAGRTRHPDIRSDDHHQPTVLVVGCSSPPLLDHFIERAPAVWLLP